MLESILAAFVADVRSRSSKFVGLADRDAAELMARLPLADEVRATAAAAALGNGYLVEELQSDVGLADLRDDRDHAGRRFDARTLHRLGLIGLLRSGQDIDTGLLIGQLAGYLSGPFVPLYRHIVLDVDWELAEPIGLPGWRLWRPNAEDWAQMRPVPLAADFAANDAFDPMLGFGRHLVLSAVDGEAQPVDGKMLWLFNMEPETRSRAWMALLALNLWYDTPVYPVAEYLVEPGRAVTAHYGSIPTTYLGPDGEVEVPQLGPLIVDGNHSQVLTARLKDISTNLERWTHTADKKAQNKLTRLKQVALRFLNTCAKVSFDSEVFGTTDRLQVAVDYVATLERLVSGDGEQSNDLARRTAQRVAVLVGRDDNERLQINDAVHLAYKVRSRIVHGDDPNLEQLATALDNMRAIVRRAISRAVILGPSEDLNELCDQALLSGSVRRERINQAISTFDKN